MTRARRLKGVFEGYRGSGTPRRITNVFRSLRYRNYRLFFAGQSVSLLGTWVQRIALPWLVFRLTDSPFLLGVVSFAGWIPAIVLSPFAGTIIDRYDRYRILIMTQVLSMVQAIGLSILYFTGETQVWLLIAMSLFLGCINAFDVPARQSFVIDMVGDKNDLGNAIALNSSMFNGARLIGPSIAGVLIAATNEGICFLINALSFVFVIGSLLAMRLDRKEARRTGAHFWDEFKEGVVYAFRFPPVREIILLLALLSLMGMPFTVLMPVFASDVLKGGSNTFGFLMGAMGLGALSGALYLASRKSVKGLWRVIAVSALSFGLSLVLFSLSNVFFLSLLLMMVVGLAMILSTASSNTMLQTVVEDDKRARIMGFYSMAMLGIFPMGSLMAGASAEVIGAPYTLMIGGSVCVLGALVFAWRLPVLQRAADSLRKGRGRLKGQ